MPSARKLARQKAARQRQEAQMRNLQEGAQKQAQAAAQQGAPPNPNDPKRQLQSAPSGFEVKVIPPGTKKVTAGAAKRVVAGGTSRTQVHVQRNPNTRSTRVQQRPDPGIPTQSYAGNIVPQQQPQQVQVPPQAFEPSHAQVEPPRPQPVAEVRREDVTVILTTFERPGYLRRQLQMLRGQTVQPQEVWIWSNAGEVPQDARTLGAVEALIFRCNANLGGWPRFERALSARTKYVCILDDDTLPGPEWLEAALARIKLAEEDPEIGTICVAAAGEVFRADNPDSRYLIGPQSPRDEEIEADIGRQGWVFQKDLLRPFVVNPPPGDGRIGWDFHLAVNLQLQNVLTVVLPYEQGSTGKWGMLEPPSTDRSLSQQLQLEVSSGGKDMAFRRRELYGAYRSIGWIPIVADVDDEEEEQGASQDAADAG